MAETEGNAEVEIAHMLGILKQRVEHRRATGVYPPGLEDELDAHFQRIAAQRIVPNIDEVQEALDRLETTMHFTRERIGLDSTLPGGEYLHKALAKAQSRQIVGVLAQLSEFASAVNEAMKALAAAVQSPTSHVHPDIVGQVDAVLERVAGYERQPEGGAEALLDLRRRVEELEAREEERRFRPWFSSSQFEDAFRGDADELRLQYVDMAKSFAGEGPVVDIGCGRGEFLELLNEAGVECVGVEVDAALVTDARERGLNVEFGDGLEYLRRVEDRSLGGIVLIQVVEHLTQQGIVDLVAVARDKLRPGGRIICETVNPQSLYVFAHSFYIDPTHTRPVHPAYLAFLFTEAGFAGVKIDWRSMPPDDDMLEAEDEAGARQRQNVEKLNRLLFAPQDYALIATR